MTSRKQCFRDMTTHRNCDSMHETEASSSQTHLSRDRWGRCQIPPLAEELQERESLLSSVHYIKTLPCVSSYLVAPVLASGPFLCMADIVFLFLHIQDQGLSQYPELPKQSSSLHIEGQVGVSLQDLWLQKGPGQVLHYNGWELSQKLTTQPQMWVVLLQKDVVGYTWLKRQASLPTQRESTEFLFLVHCAAL